MNFFLSPATPRQWRFYLLLPVIILPFVLLLFFLLGGGKAKTTPGTVNTPGLNLQLPDAHFGTKKDKNKLGLYESSKLDSERHVGKSLWDYFEPDSGAMHSFSFGAVPGTDSVHQRLSPSDKASTNSFALRSTVSNEAKEQELETKLKALQRALDQPDPKQAAGTERHAMTPALHEDNPQASNAHSMTTIPPTVFEPDPEMTQLNQMLDKLLVIQHPENKIDSLAAGTKSSANGVSVSDGKGSHTLFVIIPNGQTLVSGSTICLQLTEPATVGVVTIPADQLIYGVVSLSNERLKIQIRSLRYGKTILPVNLEGYDLDGLAGIYIPGSINREVSKESVDQGMGSLGLGTVDPSLGAQAASAGIQAAKTLISRKVKLVRVSVPAGYQLLLKESL